MQHISDMHSKFARMKATAHIMCGSTVGIQSPTADIRPGKKEERKR